MSRWSGRRAQTEPLAVLAAAVAVALALSVHVGVVSDTVPSERGREVADPVAERTVEMLRDGGVVDPTGVTDLQSPAPEGYHVNVTVSARQRQWTAGPRAPEGAESAFRLVPVRVDGAVAPGRVRVEVWT